MAKADKKEKRMFKLTGNVLPKFSLLFATLSLAACGGGGGGGTTVVKDPAPDDGNDPIVEATTLKPGIYVTIISSGTGDPDQDQEARTLLSSSGEYAIYTGSLAGTFGTLTFRSDDTFSGNGTNVFLDGTWQSIDGSIESSAISSEEQKFTATFTADTAEPDVSLAMDGSDITGVRYKDLSDLPVTIEDLYATYSLSDSTMTVTIEPDGPGGKITGYTADGCVISGAISIPDSAYNIFEGNLLFELCPNVSEASSDQRNGDYQVIGYLQPLGDDVKRLVFAGTNRKVISLFSGNN